MRERQVCPACGGTGEGKGKDGRCIRCRGKGRVLTPEEKARRDEVRAEMRQLRR